MLRVWIQKHDYSAEDFTTESEEDILRLFNSFNWANEIDGFAEQYANQGCPAGIGIIKGDRLLHFCPSDRVFGFFNYDYKAPVKLFGIFRITRNKTHHVECYEIRDFPKLLHLFLDGNESDILAISQSLTGAR